MFDLKAFRNGLGATQSEMALAMGMPLRSYQDIEAGKNPVRTVHIAAARWAAILMAADPGDKFSLYADEGAIMNKAIEAVRPLNKKPAS